MVIHDDGPQGIFALPSTTSTSTSTMTSSSSSTINLYPTSTAFSLESISAGDIPDAGGRGTIDHSSLNSHNRTSPIFHSHRYHFRASRYSWIWILGSILLLIIIHLFRTTKHRRRKRRVINSTDSTTSTSTTTTTQYKAVNSVDDEDNGEEEEEEESTIQRTEGRERAGWWIRNIRAVGAGWRNTMYLRSFPTWLYMPETVADGLWTVVYCLVYGFFCVRKTDSWFPVTKNNAANQLGVMSFSQLPIILLLVSKNNPISSLTGITYQKLNYLHRASSRACLLTSWVHALLWTPRVWEAGDTRPYLLWGIAALTGFTMLWLTSFRIIRRVAYEFFIVSHIIFSILYLVGAFFHWTRLHYWVWPAMIIWAIDRIIRGVRVIWTNNLLNPMKWKYSGDSKIELLNHDVMRVTIRRGKFNWRAGQHGFISAPSISSSPHESHPFSIANIPTETTNEAVFLIRVHSGFTKRLRLALESDVTTTLPLYLEGPYGYAHSLDSYATVVLVAGGTGVTFTLGHFLQILANARKGESAVRHLHLIWHIRHAEDVEWIAPLLNQAAVDIPTEMDVIVDVFVTKTHASDEPWPDEHLPHEQQHGHVNARGLGDRLLAEVASGGARRMLQLRGSAEDNGWDEGCRTCAPSTPMTESRDETIFLPKQNAMVGRYGLTPEAWEIVRWRRGRAKLDEMIGEDAREAEGPMNVSVCGPVQLLHAAKKAVREVSTMKSSREGLTSIDFFEETLGA
ncbi:hypothetical protein CI109_102745 [Kwoniella shandongensis]|uniref:ferric-chelate reductase (NADPH) n=1 Tax=Kwoniella shandongensis TaxID=1734106 RepID=A0A5M6C0J3_9TREE|nr:uncharacterized protein CI109_004932 [Kwoniella shandongensis]KAA5526729.1 hypothetical protein CI109_004932 [Kwoniella shandongensis]